jgi:arylsulfatase
MLGIISHTTRHAPVPTAGAKTGWPASPTISSNFALHSLFGCWKGAEKYVATTPQVFDLWADPQERYDILMNNFTEHTWAIISVQAPMEELMKSYLKYPPRKMQSIGYTGPITLSDYQRFQWIREQLEKSGFHIPIPTGN